MPATQKEHFLCTTSLFNWNLTQPNKKNTLYAPFASRVGRDEIDMCTLCQNHNVRSQQLRLEIFSFIWSPLRPSRIQIWIISIIFVFRNRSITLFGNLRASFQKLNCFSIHIPVETFVIASDKVMQIFKLFRRMFLSQTWATCFKGDCHSYLVKFCRPAIQIIN